jgi:hypothetical protein
MQVSYERTGGFAGMRMAASFDLDQLPEADAANLKALLHNAQFHKLPENLAGGPAMPDQFTYKITVTDGALKHTVTTGDASAPPELRPLLDALSQLARTKRG